MSSRKLVTLIAGIAIGVVSAAILVSLRTDETIVESPSTVTMTEDELVGQAFAERLGLPRIDSLSEGCTYVAEAPPDDLMYCVDPVVDNEREARAVSIQLTGRVATRLDMKLFDLNQELESLPSTSEGDQRRTELVQEIVATLSAIETNA